MVVGLKGKLKLSDVPTAVHIASLTHQRYADFAPCFLGLWKKVPIIHPTILIN